VGRKEKPLKKSEKQELVGLIYISLDTVPLR
jgi:hypothetical protein